MKVPFFLTDNQHRNNLVHIINQVAREMGFIAVPFCVYGVDRKVMFIPVDEGDTLFNVFGRSPFEADVFKVRPVLRIERKEGHLNGYDEVSSSDLASEEAYQLFLDKYAQKVKDFLTVVSWGVK